MIKEYFITNNNFSLISVKITKKYIIIKFKSYTKNSKYYYIFLFRMLYNITQFSVNIKKYTKYYKILILKYLI